MSQVVTGKLKVVGSWDFQDTGNSGVTKNVSSLTVNLDFGNGTGADEINKVIARLTGFTITANSSIDVDIIGTLLDFVGSTITINKVKFMLLQLADATNQAASVLIGGKQTGAFSSWLGGSSHSVRVPKSGTLAIGVQNTTGFAAGAASDLITLTNEDTANTATYKLIVCGVSG